MAPEGTFTDDMHWRYELKVGDIVDCLDSEAIWYRSTIIDERVTPNGAGKDIRELYIGYRVYDEEEGHK